MILNGQYFLQYLRALPATLHIDHHKTFRVYCGHCTYQKVKTKRPDSKACDDYLLSESAEKSFATREYLSKTLLEYMLRLDLLPEIYDIAEEQ